MSTPTDPQTLLAQAKCFLCLGISTAEALQLALLVDIVNNGSTGGGGSGVVIGVGVAQPNTFGVHNNTTGKPVLVVIVVSLEFRDDDTHSIITVTDNSGNNYALDMDWNAGVSLNDHQQNVATLTIPVPVGGHYTITNTADFLGGNFIQTNVIYPLS